MRIARLFPTLVGILFEPLTSGDRWPQRSIVQDRSCRVASSIDYPVNDLASCQAVVTFCTSQAALSALTLVAALAGWARLPIGAGAFSWVVFFGDKPSRIQGHHI